ncbi:hypothetical protein ES707_14395 [subsurface metagenome]
MNTNQFIVFLIIGITLLSGCVSSRYAQQRQRYIQQVNSGQISYDQYNQAMLTLNALEQQERQHNSLIWANAWQAERQRQHEQEMQRRRMQQQQRERAPGMTIYRSDDETLRRVKNIEQELQRRRFGY